MSFGRYRTRRSFPMSSPRPQQQSALVRYDIGLHEAYHCAYAASRGVQVLAVDVLAGYSDLTLPFAPSGMCQAFRDPEWASGQLVVIIGVLAAEAFAAQKQWPGRYYNRAVWADVQQ